MADSARSGYSPPTFDSIPEIVTGKDNQNSGDLLTEVRSKVPDIAGQEMGCPGLDRGEHYRGVFFRQRDCAWKVFVRCIKQF